METLGGKIGIDFWPTFNFLASLINGNYFIWDDAHFFVDWCSFNFLASLINGNHT